MPKLQRILETALYVDDLDRAAAFYEGPMELSPLTKLPTLYAYGVGETSVLLLFARGASMKTQTLPGGTIPPHDGSGPIHMAFAVDADALAAWETRLAAHDIVIEGRVRWEQGGESIISAIPTGICWSSPRRDCGGSIEVQRSPALTDISRPLGRLPIVRFLGGKVVA